MTLKESAGASVLLNGNGGNSNTQLITSMQNARALLLPHVRAGLAAVQNGTRNSRHLHIGDSTTFGVTPPSGTLNEKSWSYPTRYVQLLNNAGINAHANSTFGYGGAGLENNPTNDYRVTWGNSWAAYNSSTSLGGSLYNSTTTSNALSFLPTTQVDTFICSAITTASVQPYNININGGSPTNLVTAGGNGIVQATVTASLGNNTCNVLQASTGTAFFVGWEAYNSAKSWVSVINCGWPGVTAPTCAGTAAAWSTINQFSLFSPTLDLVVINLGINDWLQSTNLNTFSTAIQAIITAAQAQNADVIVMSPVPTANATVALTTQVNYVNILEQLAIANNCAFLDMWSRWVSYEVSNPLGNYSQAEHPSQQGYWDVAQALFNLTFFI